MRKGLLRKVQGCDHMRCTPGRIENEGINFTATKALVVGLEPLTQYGVVRRVGAMYESKDRVR